eukprot:6057091-Prymnesium_polylepis.1
MGSSSRSSSHSASLSERPPPGLTSGVSGSEFSPSSDVSRTQAVSDGSPMALRAAAISPSAAR